MSANKIANLVFLYLMLLLMGGCWFWEWSLWWVVYFTLLLIALKILGSVFIHLNFYLISHCSIKTGERTIALTFDDGPDENNTPRLLDLLDQFGVKATFFVIGQKAKKQPSLLKMIHNRGHLLGNHSYTHARFFDLFNFWRMRNELLWTHELIYRITGIKTLMFRPPYGVTTPVLARAVNRLGYISIGWSLRSLDTCRTPDKTLERLISKTQPGAIVLLHDTTPNIIDITRNYLEWLQKNQFQVVSLSQLLSIEVYEPYKTQ